MHGQFIKIIKILILLLLSIYLSGCATGKDFLPPSNISKNKSTIYFYSPHVLFGAAAYYDINITNNTNDTIQKSKLENNGYLKYNLDEGTYTINVKLDVPNTFYLRDFSNLFGTHKSINMKVFLSKNTLYCYKFHFKNETLNSATPTIMKIKKEECLNNLSTKKESIYY